MFFFPFGAEHFHLKNMDNKLFHISHFVVFVEIYFIDPTIIKLDNNTQCISVWCLVTCECRSHITGVETTYHTVGGTTYIIGI